MMRAGVLLAGGVSSRFGREKAVAPFGPGLLMDGPLQALAASCAEVAVSARPGSGAAAIAEVAGYCVLEDAPGGASGPLAGVLAGLRWAAERSGEFLATAPCDAATLRADQVEALFAAALAGGAAAGQTEFGLEPLLAVWPVGPGLQVVQAALADGGHPPVRDLLSAIGLQIVKGFDGVNVNAPSDLMALGSSDPSAGAGEPPHARLFAFEDDFVRTLRCIPMCVRFKLDQAGVKLSLRQWSRFNLQDRRRLRLTPCATPSEVEAYRALLTRLIHERAGEAPSYLARAPEPAWQSEAPPREVEAFASTRGVSAPTCEGWRALGELERYTLVKLTRDKHENANFAPAMREFGLL